ncbi:hypothetical protein B0H21DRAFT_808880 [Amylocystis lapponica]|nr:hypothetical protein B0H21DRAFT_808880 [Amylocystis lapponica]
MTMLLSDYIAALIIGFACESVLYGAYCVLFLISLTVLVWYRSRSNINVPLLVANIVLFLSCTAHWVLEFNIFYTMLQSPGTSGYVNVTRKIFGAEILLSLIDFFGDAVFIYRCWLVWRRNYGIIVLPFLTALAAGFACIIEITHLVLTTDFLAPVAPVATPLGIAGYAIALATNVLVTLLISGRIWALAHAGADVDTAGVPMRGRALAHHAIGVIVESGALYLAVQLVYLVLLTLEHPAQGIAGGIAAQIFGIAPTLIIIRVALGLAVDSECEGTAGTSIVWNRSVLRATALTTGTGACTDSGWGMRNEFEFEHGCRKMGQTDMDDDVSSVVPL